MDNLRPALGNKEHGAVLLIVLVFSLLASLLVVTSLRDNLVQERLSGNFQKQVNAQLLAEQGMHESYNQLKTQLQRAPNQGLQTLYEQLPAEADGSLEGSSYALENGQIAGADLSLDSRGNHLEGEAKLNAQFTLQGSHGNTIFNDAIVSCESLNLTGSSSIDGYDSRKGAYGDSISNGQGGSELNQHGKGNVTTIEPNANITLTGNAPIYGDVSATGSVTLTGSSDIHGSIQANNDVTLGTGTIGGNVAAGNNFNLANSGTVEGSVKANNNASTAPKAQVNGTLQYGGDGNFHQDSQIGNLVNARPNVPPVPTKSCDPLDIGAVMGGFKMPNNGARRIDSNANVTITPSGSSKTELGWKGDYFPSLTPTSENIFGSDTPVFNLDSLVMSADGVLNISGGDVTLIVNGDFKMSGSNQLNIAPGSSLTLFVGGEVAFSAGTNNGNNIKGQTLTDSNKPPLSIFSGSDKDVTVSGNVPIYAALYAPKSKVNLPGGPEIFGSVRGKSITATGNGKIHYDNALGAADLGEGNANPAVILLKQWQYL